MTPKEITGIDLSGMNVLIGWETAGQKEYFVFFHIIAHLSMSDLDYNLKDPPSFPLLL